MASTLVATTRNADLQPLGAGGQHVVDLWQQLARHLEHALGGRHAALLAEPQPDASRGVTDWYATLSGTPTTLDALPEAEREAARSTLAALVADIQGEIARLRASRREADQLLAELLRLVLVTPTADSLRVVAGQPVLAAWGHAPVNASPNPELLLAQLARPTRPPGGPAAGPMAIVGPPPASPPARPPWAALAALLLALLLLLLALLLLLRDPFGWFGVTPPQCAVAPQELELAERLRAEQAREATLRGRIAEQVQRLGQQRLACPPPAAPGRAAVPAPTPAPGPTPTPPSADAERAREQGARSGRVQIILAWDDLNDLDLSVICPGGQRIFYGNPAACGGTLDVDRNAGNPTARPVENIVFDREPGRGSYRVEVHHFGRNPGGPPSSPFRVTLRREGQPDQTFTGNVAVGQRAGVTTFTVP